MQTTRQIGECRFESKRIEVEGADAVVPVRRREGVWHRTSEWGQPPAEKYCLDRIERGGVEPLVRGKRDNEIWSALLEHAERYWIERDPEMDLMWVCAVSKRSGRLFRYRTRASSSIVRWMRWRYKRKKARDERFTRCTCKERGWETCPLCEEARAGVEEEYE